MRSNQFVVCKTRPLRKYRQRNHPIRWQGQELVVPASGSPAQTVLLRRMVLSAVVFVGQHPNLLLRDRNHRPMTSTLVAPAAFNSTTCIAAVAVGRVRSSVGFATPVTAATDAELLVITNVAPAAMVPLRLIAVWPVEAPVKGRSEQLLRFRRQWRTTSGMTTHAADVPVTPRFGPAQAGTARCSWRRWIRCAVESAAGADRPHYRSRAARSAAVSADDDAAHPLPAAVVCAERPGDGGRPV